MRNLIISYLFIYLNTWIFSYPIISHDILMAIENIFRASSSNYLQRHFARKKITGVPLSSATSVVLPARKVDLNDEIIAEMMGKMDTSRDEAMFYLESSVYNLEQAIATYRSLSSS